MGNVVGRQEDELVDGGLLFPTGQVYPKTDCDLRVVRRLIKERRIAPFFRGEADETSNATNECPICFLYMPNNINLTRCCQQMICTECFLQIKQPVTGGPAVCPFCVRPDFGVLYDLQKIRAGSDLSDSMTQKEKKPEPARKPSLPNSPDVVTVDIVRPNGRHYPPPAQTESFSRRSSSTRAAARLARSQRRNHYPDLFEQDLERPRNATVGRDFAPFSTAAATISPQSHRSSRRSPIILPASSYAEGTRFASRNVQSELDQLMLMEAIRLSLLDQNPNSASASPTSPSSSSEDQTSPQSATRQRSTSVNDSQRSTAAHSRLRLENSLSESEHDDDDDDDDDDEEEEDDDSTKSPRADGPSPDSSYLIDLVRRHGGSPEPHQHDATGSSSTSGANFHRSTSTVT